MKRKLQALPLLLGLILLMVLAAPASQTSQEQPAQEQPAQEQAQKDQQKKKKKGGFFGGLKAVTGQSSEQQEATATAGSKSVGEGQKIGDVVPTASDRQQVTGMENYSIPEKDLKKFQDDGHLKPKQ